MTLFDIERFAGRFAITDSCWNWTAGRNSHGYGGFFLNGKMYHAHRIMHVLTTGKPIPQKMHVDHLCRNTQCINPKHLEVVTHRENILRGHNVASRNAVKTHCPSGHEYNERNTYVDKLNRRYCRICRKQRNLIERNNNGRD